MRSRYLPDNWPMTYIFAFEADYHIGKRMTSAVCRYIIVQTTIRGGYSFRDCLNTFTLIQGRKERNVLFYGYMASDIRESTTQIVREETRCGHMGYTFRLTARVILYAPYHRHSTGICETVCGPLVGIFPPRNVDPSAQNAQSGFP